MSGKIRAIPPYQAHLLRGILRALKADRPLTRQQKEFLVAAIEKVFRGLPADMAFASRRVGRPNQATSATSLEIFDRVNELLADGHSKQHAYRQVVKELRRKRVTFSIGGIEKRFYRTAKAFGQN